MTRLLVAIALLFSISACSEFKDLDEVPEPLGRFLLGHNIVVANEPEIGPLSRKVTDEAWEASVTSAIDERFSRYDGDKYFHIAVKVEGYVLALPGIPLVASPSSSLIIGVTLWDDALGAKINDEPKRFVVFERLSGETLLSSGLTQNKEQQMENLARNAAKMIHNWMLETPELFGDASLMDPATTSPGRPRLQPEATTDEPEPDA